MKIRSENNIGSYSFSFNIFLIIFTNSIFLGQNRYKKNYLNSFKYQNLFWPKFVLLIPTVFSVCIGKTGIWIPSGNIIFKSETGDQITQY